MQGGGGGQGGGGSDILSFLGHLSGSLSGVSFTAYKQSLEVIMFVCFPAVTTHCGCIFHSSVAGFSLLILEVS